MCSIFYKNEKHSHKTKEKNRDTPIDWPVQLLPQPRFDITFEIIIHEASFILRHFFDLGTG